MRAKAMLEVEFLAGSELKDCIEEASRIARQLDLAYVVFSFNETKFSISQRPDIGSLISLYLSKKKTYIVDKRGDKDE